MGESSETSVNWTSRGVNNGESVSSRLARRGVAGGLSEASLT